MRVDQSSELRRRAQKPLGAGKNFDLMVAPAVEGRLLLPLIRSVQRGDPAPLLRRPGQVHVDEVLVWLQRHATHVINEHRVIWVVFRASERQRTLFDLHREQHNGVRCFDMDRSWISFGNDNLLAVTNAASLGAERFDPAALGRLAVTQRLVEGSNHGFRSIGTCVSQRWPRHALSRALSVPAAPLRALRSAPASDLQAGGPGPATPG